MNFLDQVNRLASESGATGAAASVAAVTGQTGQSLRLVNWVRASWNEIQNLKEDWRWMRSRFTVNTVAGTDSYAYGVCTDSRLSATITRFARWWPYSELGEPGMTRYLTSAGVAGEVWLVPLPWPTFRRIYLRGPQTLVRNVPVHVSIDPQNNLRLGPNPNDIYTIQGEYQMGAQVLAADSDTPEMPLRFHDLIWLRALEKYGRYYAAGEAIDRGEVEGGAMLSDIEQDQLPALTFGPPLA